MLVQTHTSVPDTTYVCMLKRSTRSQILGFLLVLPSSTVQSSYKNTFYKNKASGMTGVILGVPRPSYKNNCSIGMWFVYVYRTIVL